MEELPEYQICPKCGKSSTPYKTNCWSCGEPFFPCYDTEYRNNHVKASAEKKETQEFVPENISPCTLEDMNFTDRMFAYSLLFRGEMVLEFCECEICSKAFRDILAFFNESDADDEKIIKEAEETDLKGMILDISGYGL